MIHIDGKSKVPPYEQIRTQIASMIRSGDLLDGEKLPSIRQLAGDLQVAPGTVARAYKNLEEGGLIESKPRSGSRVAGAHAANAQLAAAAKIFVDAARSFGMTPGEASAMVKTLWRE